MRVLILIPAFRYRKITIENKDEDFINLTFFEIVNIFNIDEIRDDFDLRRFM